MGNDSISCPRVLMSTQTHVQQLSKYQVVPRINVTLINVSGTVLGTEYGQQVLRAEGVRTLEDPLLK